LDIDTRIIDIDVYFDVYRKWLRKQNKERFDLIITGYIILEKA